MQIDLVRIALCASELWQVRRSATRLAVVVVLGHATDPSTNARSLTLARQSSHLLRRLRCRYHLSFPASALTKLAPHATDTGFTAPLSCYGWRPRKSNGW